MAPLFKKLICFSLCLSLTLAAVWGKGIPWKEPSFYQYADGVNLKEFLENFCSFQGINLKISSHVDGIQKVSGRFDSLTPDEFLKTVSKAYNLIWAYDGNVLHVYSNSEIISSQLIDVENVAVSELFEIISEVGIIAPSSFISINGPIALISGPPSYVNMVTEIAQNLTIEHVTRQKTIAKRPVIKVFLLKHAWAYDTSFNSERNEITIPGIARTLRGLMETDIGPSAIISGSESKTQDNTGRIVRKASTIKRTEGVAAKGEYEEQSNYATLEGQKDKDKKTQGDSQSITEQLTTGDTLIQADTRLNAVIVRDFPDKIPQYEAIIAALDIPVQIIEISALVVDIDSNYSRSLGVGHFNFQDTGGKNNPFGKPTLNLNPSGTDTSELTEGFNFDFNTIVNGFSFSAQIQALQQDGNAQVLARPSVLTLNNFEAVITQTDTFYVQVSSTNAADLATVTAQTRLTVTPRAIEENNNSQIKLLVEIEDGTNDNSSDSQVNGFPVTKTTTITTQAIVPEGQSLLIGGLQRQVHSKSDNGIPILKDIPLLGYLFKSKVRSDTSTERMFLITPRLIDFSSDQSPDVQPYFDKPVEGIAGSRYELRNMLDKSSNSDSIKRSVYLQTSDKSKKRPSRGRCR